MLSQYREIWSADFEFGFDLDRRPVPTCLTARELRSGRRVALWRDEMGPTPPYPTDRGSLFLAYHASAETSCHLALGWPLPLHILDLEAEFRCATTGHEVSGGKGLLGALQAYGLPSMQVAEKRSMIDLILRGEPFTPEERAAIVAYCWEDTDGAADLFPLMLPGILARPNGLELALVRGEYSGHAIAHMEYHGTPLDMPTLGRFRCHWDAIKHRLVEQYDPAFGVYDSLSFRMHKFLEYLYRNEIPWPTLESGDLDLKDDTFKEMAEIYPQLAPLRQLRHTLSQLRVHDLAAGDDGRNRCLLGQFVANTGRNAPKASEYIFGPSTWLRGLIQPRPGRTLAYLDWSSQEMVVAAALSGDPNMLAAIASGDAYMAFAKMAGLVSWDARREDHEALREVCKRCCLGILYGMGIRALAFRTRLSELEARDLMERHRKVFPVFWAWSERAVREASLLGYIDMALGWRIHDGPATGRRRSGSGKRQESFSSRSLMNAPMQSNAAGMMWVAACLGTRAGVQIDAVLHDAFLIEAAHEELDDAIATMRGAMNRASAIVLEGVIVGVDEKRVSFPDRYMDPRGVRMWRDVMGHLAAIERAA